MEKETEEVTIEKVKGGTNVTLGKEVEVVIGTKEEALWQNLKDQAEQRVLNSIASIEIDKMVITRAEQKLKDLKPVKVPLN